MLPRVEHEKKTNLINIKTTADLQRDGAVLSRRVEAIVGAAVLGRPLPVRFSEGPARDGYERREREMLPEPDVGADATSRKRALSAKAVRILTIAKCDGSLSVSL